MDFFLILALAGQESVPAARMTQAAREALLLLGALLPVVALALVWATFLRRKRKRHHRHHEHVGVLQARQEDGSAPQGGRKDAGKEGGTDRHPHHRHHRRHRSRYPLNPTLADIGGLPVRREDEPESDSAPSNVSDSSGKR